MSNPDPMPAYLAALHDALVDSAELSAVQIDIGPPQSEYDTPDSIALGVTVERNLDATMGSRSYTLDSQRLLNEVYCVAQTWSGSVDDMAQCIIRVHQLIDIVGDVLAKDPSVGVAGVTDSVIIRSVFRPLKDAKGALAFVEFVIRVDAYR